jgi:hypothetical protein
MTDLPDLQSTPHRCVIMHAAAEKLDNSFAATDASDAPICPLVRPRGKLWLLA